MADHEGLSPQENDGFEEHERISEEDVFAQIEENFRREETIVSPEIPLRDLDAMRDFMVAFNVVDAESISYDDLEHIWYRLARDPSIRKDYAYMPAILKDYAYLLTDYRTRINFSDYPLPIHKDDFIRHSAELEAGKFSPRMHMIEKVAIPNLERLGVAKDQIVENASGDMEGRIRAAEFVRFLGWLTSQEFMRDLRPRIQEYKERNEKDRLTLTDVASVATVKVMSELDSLYRKRHLYNCGYPMETAATQRYHEVVSAMNGIYNLCDKILLGAPKQK